MVGRELGKELTNPGVKVIADRANLAKWTAFRIGDRPIEIPLAGIDRARVAAAHRHHHVSGGDHIVGEWFGVLGTQVDAKFLTSLRRRSG